MSGEPLWTVTFAELESRVWGAAAGPHQLELLLGLLGETHRRFPDARIGGSDPQELWRITADGLELELAPASPPVQAAEADDAPGGFDQLCRVRGRTVFDGAERQIDVIGRRGWRDGAPDYRRIESVRDFSAFFGPGDGVTLVSLRPRKARGHSDDRVTAALFDGGRPIAVADPRLSTTYKGSDEPWRVGLELWLDDQPADGDGEEPREQYPRRFAAEVLELGAAVPGGAGAELRPALMRCHGRAGEGAGVYLLIQSR